MPILGELVASGLRPHGVRGFDVKEEAAERLAVREEGAERLDVAEEAGGGAAAGRHEHQGGRGVSAREGGGHAAADTEPRW